VREVLVSSILSKIKADKSLAALLLLALAASACARDPAKVREFRRLNPCPATGRTTGACGGYVVDHKWPLCAGGPDAIDNLQWQTEADALAKDKIEWRVCRQLRAHGYKADRQ
jgi:hypothetical protein